MLQQRSGRCVCAFDFDHTLRVERDGRQDAAALDAKGIVSDCKSKGYAVAIASANDDVSKIAPVLGRVDGSTFNDGFYKTSAFQVGQADKSQEMRRIAEWYRTPAECIMLFDDSWFNKKYADETGAVWRRVSGSSGVRWRDYEQARKDLQRQCDCR